MKWLCLMFFVIGCFAQEIKRPTIDADSGNAGCAGQRVASSSMSLAHDAAGLTTSSTVFGAGTMTASIYSARTFSNWTAAGSSYTSLNLNINSLSPGAGCSVGNGCGNACIYYSTNAGSSFTKIRCDADVSGAGWSRTTDVVALPSNQDLTKLRVSVCAQGNKGNTIQSIDPGTDEITIWDIWTSGSSNPPSAGTGSSAGLPHRAIVSVN